MISMADIKVPKKMMQQDDGESFVQQEAILYQILQKQLGRVSVEIEKLNHKSVEAAATKEGLKELGSAAETLIPIGSGCYACGKIVDTKNVLVDIGFGVLVPKTREDADSMIAEKESEISKLKSELHENCENIVKQMNSIAMKICGK